ncbi:sigma-54-dependent Fis family transcriptional regulator [Pelosinus fermentans]|uniref:Proprionate catabolism activator, Fis family n=1 Tax=Pelosinus fermentans JBW45 TaxID=1192197 RepID=I9DBA5_9FIRM|nr:sigma-54-dependent Fis family transcriptional regulator [Pelosinus fermentans]AJQ29634.1 proprionate catabolism activator, Fis family [Pelosinus fermentans JBW45]
MEARILFVAPFADLAKLAEEVVAERFADSSHLIKVVKGDLQECIAIVKQAVEDGVEVIVSRGGTANLIKKNVNIPTVHIQVTVMDVLRALRQSTEYPEKIGIAGFENVIYGCEDLATLLGITFVEIALKNEDEAPEKIAAAVKNGVELIVGDAISTKIAARIGVQGALIQSGKEAIYKAINEAALIAHIRREEQEKAELLGTVIDTSAEGIIATDTNDRITIFNPMAEKIFQVSHLEAIGNQLQTVIPQFSLAGNDDSSEKMADVQRIGDKTLTIKYNQIKVKGEIIGSIYNFQNVSQLQQLEQNVRKKLHAKGLVARIKMADIVGLSSACNALKRKAAKYALTQSTILITGESGTGKEMLVQSIHNVSTRAEGPFVAVNCAALPENLLESELFGYAEGAFTGAKKGGRQGLFELAHGGTLFLDEIGEMPLSLQSRLLRVLQEKAVMHLGGDTVIPVDVRIVAATNQNLAKLIEEKNFRQDLYYRLNILRIHMPTLRERIEDIPLLAKEMIKKMKHINGKVTGIHLEAREYLKQRSWPGNIRQLANTIERAMLLSSGPIISKQDMIEAYDEEGESVGEGSREKGEMKDSLAMVEHEILLRVLGEEEYNYNRAAARLGIHRTTLWRKLNAKAAKK